MITFCRGIVSFLFFCSFINPNGFALRSQSALSEARKFHSPRSLNSTGVKSVSYLMDDMSKLNATLKNILLPRVVGTEAHTRVGNYIINQFKILNWDVELDTFTDKTPIGVLSFRNIIASHNPNARRFLDIACHYDSKYYPGINRFVGATDSAVPCAMMIQLAHSLTNTLNSSKNNNLSLRFIFFDGEEAFQSWSKTDSTYGARHLAAKWKSTPYSEGGPLASQLDRMDMLVLLDLLGAESPEFYSFFPNTHKFYSMLANAESKLKDQNLLRGYYRRYFLRKSTDAYIEDDHLPFLHENVPILHLITIPFPSVWHTIKDDSSIIDLRTTKNLVKIIAVFITEYLNLYI